MSAPCVWCHGAGCVVCGEPATGLLPPTQRPSRHPLVQTHPTGNPCVAVFGAGPEGARCATCTHLFAFEYSRVYYKCGLRPNTNGPGTDHRLRWPACAKYQQRQKPIEPVAVSS